MKPTEVYWNNLDAFLEGYRVIANKGSSRSSKTYSIMQLLDTIARKSEKHIKISVVCSTFPRLKAGAIYEYEKYLRGENIAPDKIHNKSDHFFSVGNSVIEYFSVDNSDKVIGPGRDVLYINECNVGITFETFRQLRQRTSGTIFLDYNPSGKFWLHSEEILSDPRTKMIHSTFKNNLENLSDDQIQDFVDAYEKAKHSERWKYWVKVYAEGEDGVLLEERIMPFLKKVKEVPNDAVEIPSGLDFGFFPDPTAFCRLWVRKNHPLDDLYIKELVYDTKLSINAKGADQNLTDVLEARGHNKNHLIIAESADPRSIRDMRNAGFNITSVKKTKVETSLSLFHDYNIHVLEGSDNAYYELDNYKYKRDRKTGEILGIPEDGQPDHICDNIRYVLSSRGYRWNI